MNAFVICQSVPISATFAVSLRQRTIDHTKTFTLNVQSSAKATLLADSILISEQTTREIFDALIVIDLECGLANGAFIGFRVSPAILNGFLGAFGCCCKRKWCLASDTLVLKKAEETVGWTRDCNRQENQENGREEMNWGILRHLKINK
jgi:hypothetical protein